MTNQDIFAALGEIDGALVLEAAPRYEEKRVRRIWYRVGALAACLCLIAFGAWRLIPREDPIIPSGDVAFPYVGEWLGGAGDSEGSTGSSESFVRVPEAGDVYFGHELTEARRAQAGKQVEFLVQVRLFSATGEVSEADYMAEYRRLHESGVRVYRTSRWVFGDGGERLVGEVVLLAMTEGQLAAFVPDARYGYHFYFAKNGDGSALAVKEYERILHFD